MEVRVQPRNEARQRCLSFSLDVTPRRMSCCTEIFSATPCITSIILASMSKSRSLRMRWWRSWRRRCLNQGRARLEGVGHFHRERRFLGNAATQPIHAIHLVAGGTCQRAACGTSRKPSGASAGMNEALYRAFAYVPNSTKVDSPSTTHCARDRVSARICTHNDRAGEAPQDSMPVRKRLSVPRG